MMHLLMPAAVHGKYKKIRYTREYPQVAGNLRAGSVRSEGASAPSLGTLNRELMLKPAKPACVRQISRKRELTEEAA